MLDLKSKKPLIIAGPCSAETSEQTLQTAEALAATGKVDIFRAGVWKPRTKPGGFEGAGIPALPWLVEVKKRTGMPVAIEVANAKHVESALAFGIDMFWIGARTTSNPFSVQEIAEAMRGSDTPVLVKNPMNADIELWNGAVERLAKCNIKNLGLIHRGFSGYGSSKYRNTPMWHLALEIKKRLPELPIFCDPSHIGGKRELVAPLCQQAMDLNFDGLIIESHCNPDKAWSDASQQVTPDVLDYILSMLTIRETVDLTASLSTLRKGIDEIDNELIDLLAKRMGISREIGAYKRDNGMTIVQTKRYSEILDKRAAQGVLKGIDAECIKKIFECIHEESVRQQVELLR